MLLGSMLSSVIATTDHLTNFDDAQRLQNPPAGPTESIDFEENNLQDQVSNKQVILENSRPRQMEKEPNLKPEDQVKTSDSQSKTMTLSINFPSPEIITDGEYLSLEMHDCVVTGAPGEPEVVAKVLNFEFKPLTKLQVIEFIPDRIITEILPYQLKPIQ